MAAVRSLLIVLSQESRAAWAAEIGALVSSSVPSIVITGSPADAARQLIERRLSPSHIVLDIGTRGQDIFTEVDQLAQQCEAGTRVLAVGDTNDIVLYRGLITRGVIDYLPLPVNPSEVVRVLTTPAVTPVTKAPVTAAADKRVITFISAASGDGGSTAALNTAYALSQMYNGSTIIVDMDYQFGMVAKNLNLQNQYGIGDLFDRPDRALDATLIQRMVANYGKLHVITAPIELRFLPIVSADVIRDLVTILQQTYDNVIIDLPHVWLPWVASVTQQSTNVVLVAQLWLKSVSNAARMMRVFREMGIPADRIATVINRSGAKFKEAIDAKDFERVCGTPIRYTLVNDIKTVVNAEAAARTVMEMEPSELATNIQRLARGLSGQSAPPSPVNRGGLFSKLKG